jgi:HEPN domain-containing protein
MGRSLTVTPRDVEYRLRVARGFLDESRQDIAANHWRSTVDNGQLAVENAAKAVLALVAPVGRTHNPAPLLRQALADGRFPTAYQGAVQRLAECAEILGFDIHVQTDYGDEFQGRTPWELFDEQEANEALAIAEEAVNLAQMTVQGILP